jgi:citrate synthase
LNTFAEIGTKENIPAYLEKVKRKEKKLTGFGHRVYKTYDPRALIIKNLCKQLHAELGLEMPPLFHLAEELEKAAVNDEYFKSRNLYPNIDFYSGFILESLQIPHNMFCVIFAITRCLGWVTHWREMMSESMIKIGRPRQIYVGSKLRPFVQIDKRVDAKGFEIKATPLSMSRSASLF